MLENLFGEILREERNKKGLSQADLANLSSFDRTYISLLERGLRQPTLSSLFRIANALDVPPTYLVQKLEQRYEDRK